MTDLVKSDIEQDTVFSGIGVSPGIAIGEIFLLSRAREPGVVRHISVVEISREIQLFNNAVELSKQQLREAKDKIVDKKMHEHLFIIDAHLLILQDQMFIDDTILLIRKELLNAEGALKQTLQKFQAVFDSIEDEYLRDRKSDLDSVGDRLVRNLRGEIIRSVSEIEQKTILAAHDLSPADAMQIDRSKVVGVITDLGGRTSHTAILARSLGIPAVFGMENFTSFMPNGTPVVVDGTNGLVIVKPSDATFKDYLAKKQALEYAENKLHSLICLPAETLDGQRIFLRSNIELAEEADFALSYGAEGVGLYRTEILFLNRPDIPSEDEQFKAFQVVVKKMAPHPTTIRTLDIGGEKIVPEISLKGELNPAMGLRAVRFSLKEVELFKIQLRAILRASQYGRVRIMFPMISSLSEVRACKAYLEEVKGELKAENIPFDSEISVGIMVETPAAALIADFLAREVDFFSVGTNDLIQYSLAVDRSNKNVAYLYEPFHPSVLRLLKMIGSAARKAGIRATVCGEMAADPLYTMVLLGAGFEELSMNALFIPAVKRILRDVSRRESEELLEHLLLLPTSEETGSFLKKEMTERFPDIFQSGKSGV